MASGYFALDTERYLSRGAARLAELNKARRKAYMREYSKAYYSRFKGAKPGMSPRAAAQHDYYIARKLREAGVKP